jgi:hypothetical protein
VIAAYALLGAVGRLDVKTLALSTPDYAPEVHYHQVRDAISGHKSIYSITALAGNTRSSAFAVLRLRTNSNLVGF